VVIVRAADKLVKDFRPDLEAYLANPSSAGRLFLELLSCPANTRLYKLADSDHLLVHCGVPASANSKNKSPDLTKLKQFLLNVVAPLHRCKLQAAAAERLMDLTGLNVGMLETEIAKLALYEQPGGTITESMVNDIVGGWRASTIWQTIDAAAAGNAAEALKQLDRMMASGEAPIGLLPLIAWSMRRFGLATAAIDHAERTGDRMNMSQALTAAGFRPFELTKSEAQMRQLGRQRTSRILGWLLDADAKLKGSHSTPGLDRHVLEELVLRLAKT
jgi:DNA polymerase-3 subunit delta